jgi:rare lipoprotein A
VIARGLIQAPGVSAIERDHGGGVENRFVFENEPFFRPDLAELMILQLEWRDFTCAHGSPSGGPVVEIASPAEEGAVRPAPRSWLLSSAFHTMVVSFSRLTSRLPAAGRSLRFWSVCLAAAAGGCAQQPAQRVSSRSSEYFPSSVYGPASQRVVADGQPVPRGGGQYLVGRPYTVAGRRYYPTEAPHESQVGMASYYGSAFHGRRTANGEVFDMSSVSAAHPTMPLPSYARVTNLTNGRSIIVRVNDRGPYHGGRVLDVSQRVAEALDFRRMGTARVKVDYVGRAGLDGSDDNKLMASLRTDGSPASLDGSSPASRPVMVASAPPIAPLPRPVEQRPVALAAPRQAPVEEVEAAPVPSRTTVLPVNAPLPPSRPFDLGTIPGAATPIAASAPPRRPTSLSFNAVPSR